MTVRTRTRSEYARPDRAQRRSGAAEVPAVRVPVPVAAVLAPVRDQLLEQRLELLDHAHARAAAVADRRVLVGGDLAGRQRAVVDAHLVDVALEPLAPDGVAADPHVAVGHLDRALDVLRGDLDA